MRRIERVLAYLPGGRGVGGDRLHDIEPLSVGIGRACGAFLYALAILAGSAACGAPSPTPSGTPALPSPSPPIAPSPPLGQELAELHWYEVERANDTHGNEWRTLFAGSLNGKLLGQILLGTLETAEDGSADAFAWIDPQADGIFDDSVVVWGRRDGAGEIEAVRLADASIEPLVPRTAGTVHVATADARLRHVFFITVDEATDLPTGLWVDDVDDDVGARRIGYRFSETPVSNRFKYRLVADHDGSVLAVQAGLEGPVTLVPVPGGGSREVDPGGPMIGFAENALIAYGPRSATDRRPVVAFDVTTLRHRILIDEIDSAQIVPGSAGALVAVQVNDPINAGSFVIGAVSVRTGVALGAFTHDPAEIWPGLASRDRSFLGAQAPPDWVLLVDVFFPFVQGTGAAPKDLPLSSYPKLLNLRTGERLRIGPFAPFDDG